jgi:putative NADPH-quinone reductase
MQRSSTIIGVVGSYRKGGIIDSAVDEVLSAAAECGAHVNKIYLLDKQIAFCTNCRECTQQPGDRRGACVIKDDMAALLDTLEGADAIVLGSPINFFCVTALTKRFVERLVCYAWWPWGARVPRRRTTRRSRRAVLLLSCAMPAFMARVFCGAPRVLKSAATLLGARCAGLLIIGGVAQQEHQPLPDRARRQARRLGCKLVRQQVDANMGNKGGER